MKRLLVLGFLCGLGLSASAQEIFRTRWQGVGVQSFSSTTSINRFSVSGPDDSGYVNLKAHSITGSRNIIRTMWQGTAVQEFTPGASITGFETSGPDFEGYVTLTAVALGGAKQDILRTRWQGTAVQPFSAPSGHSVLGFSVSGPDPDGYVVLSAVTAPIGVAEPADPGRLPRQFALNSILPNPGPGSTRIAYSIPKTGPVTFSMYDCSGKLVAEVFDGEKKPGFHHLDWTGTDSRGNRVGTGVYFITMNAGGFKATSKIVVVR